jgi:hypothetical protein
LAIGQVSVRVIPVTCCTDGTMLACKSVRLSAPMRTTTSYGPVTYSDDYTPGRPASCLATTSARPTSVWIRMKASTTRFPSVLLHRLLAAGPKRTAARGR